MSKKTGILLLLVSAVLSLHAQEDSLSHEAYSDSLMQERLKSPVKRNAFFIDIGGNNALWSINYDRTIIGYRDVYITARVGYTHIIRFRQNTTELEIEYSRNFFPLEVNLLYDYARHFFGIGLGGLVAIDKDIIRSQRICGAGLVFPKLKYRYQGLDGLFANVELGAWHLSPNEEGCKKRFYFAPGVALGYCF